MRSKGDIVLLSGDKDSCVVIMDKKKTMGKKVEQHIQGGIRDGNYEYTTDRTHEELENLRALYI